MSDQQPQAPAQPPAQPEVHTGPTPPQDGRQWVPFDRFQAKVEAERALQAQLEQYKSAAESVPTYQKQIAELTQAAEGTAGQLARWRAATSRGFVDPSTVEVLEWQHSRTGADQPFETWLDAAIAQVDQAPLALRAILAQRIQQGPAGTPAATAQGAAGAQRGAPPPPLPPNNANAAPPPPPAPRMTPAEAAAIASDPERMRKFAESPEGRALLGNGFVRGAAKQ